MHELGIVKHVMRTLTDVAAENDLKIIGGVTLEIGEVSGVVVEQLTDCWDYFSKKDPLFERASLKVETIPALTWCDDCGKTYETVRYGRICPCCGGPKTWLLQGNEFNIKEIEAE